MLMAPFIQDVLKMIRSILKVFAFLVMVLSTKVSMHLTSHMEQAIIYT